MSKLSPRRSGFTLVELAVVLVIIGLIVGGVLAGSSMIRAAELNAVISESRKYITAIGQFRDKYNNLPGDMSTAVNYWGNTDTGNGDGDGKIENTATSIGAAEALTSNEISNFWIQLTKASLIEGSFTAVADSTTAMTAGTNNPRSKAKGAGWNVAYLGTVGYDSSSPAYTGARAPAAGTFFDGTYEHALLLGSGKNSLLPTGILAPDEAYNIDTKLDDGVPATGDVMTLESQGGNTCSTNATSAAATATSGTYYLTGTNAAACSLVFKTGF